MKNLSRVLFSVLAAFSLALLISASPLTATPPGQDPAKDPAAQHTLSVSGKIATVDATSFSLTVADKATSQVSSISATSPKTMTFTIDKNTTIDGKLKVGANADVTYRQEGGNNIAISVHVS
jgi:Cu/Ag efflux protein CusF